MTRLSDVRSVASMGHKRIAITGGPGTGKSTFALDLSAVTGAPIKHTDRLISLGWSPGVMQAARWFDAEGSWVVEGVTVPHALAKWLEVNPTGKPVDVLLFRSTIHRTQSPRQKALDKGIRSVMKKIFHDLRKRGVQIVTG